MNYTANTERYHQMIYNRLGNSGLLLPAISLGMWHNFGDVDTYSNSREILLSAFDHGVTHFDLANNYGPSPGSAELTFGKLISDELAAYRDEIIVSSKAGYDMWEGPYGEFGSRKHVIASAHQSLKRLKLDYVDIFYSHRYDGDTPLEETMLALDQLVREGKALYVGISNYSAEKTLEASRILKDLKTPFVIHQLRYNLLDRTAEEGLLDVLDSEGIGGIAYSPLEQGLLTDRYLHGIPENSRAAKSSSPFLNRDDITEEKVACIRELNSMANNREQSLAQMAVAWLLSKHTISSVLIGASSVQQLKNNIDCVKNISFSEEELHKIEELVKHMRYVNHR
jgi:L-glyceraldehyde 3-phosphate reductase